MVVRTKQKEEKINQLIEWCESLEKDILESAEKGTWCIYPTPKNYGYLLPFDERNKIIIDFFEHYGYAIKYRDYKADFHITWN